MTNDGDDGNGLQYGQTETRGARVQPFDHTSTFETVDKTPAINQKVLFIMLYKVVLTFKSVDETPVRDHSNESC